MDREAVDKDLIERLRLTNLPTETAGGEADGRMTDFEDNVIGDDFVDELEADRATQSGESLDPSYTFSSNGETGDPILEGSEPPAHEKTKLKDEVGLYFQNIARTPLLTREEERYLGWSIINDNDQESRQRLIESNLRLVVSISKKYTIRGGKARLTFMDLISYGNHGLIKAVDKFDPAIGNRFTTLATWWIKAGIRRGIAVNSGGNAYVPPGLLNLKHVITKASEELRTGDVELTIENIASCAGVTQESVVNTQKARKFLNSISLEYIDKDWELTQHEIPIYDPVDPMEEVPSESIDLLLARLTKLGENVIRLRYGLSGHEPMTLEAIGKEFGVSRARVGQIEVKALKKLRKYARGVGQELKAREQKLESLIYLDNDGNPIQYKMPASELLDFLTEREERIIRLRYGLPGPGSLTYIALAKETGETVYMAMQIEKKALKKLRKYARGVGQELKARSQKLEGP